MKRLAVVLCMLFGVMALVMGQQRDIINEDFDSLTLSIPDGWSNSDNTLSVPAYNWTYYAPGYGDEGKCLRFNSYTSRAGEMSRLKTPVFELSREQLLRFKFRNPTGGDLSVYLSIDGGMTLSNLLEANLKSTEWVEREYSLSAYTGQKSVCIVWQSTSNAGTGDAFHYLDDVVVEDIPLCSRPQNLALLSVTQNSAFLTWNLSGIGGLPEKYRLFVYDVKNLTTDTIEFVAEDLMYELEGLAPNKAYEVTLQAYCGVGRGYSDVSEAVKLTTMCEMVAMPVAYDFDDVATAMPECWTVDLANPGGATVQNEVKCGASGKALKLVATTTKGVYVATPILAHAANDLDVRMKLYAAKGTSFAVGVMSDPSLPESYEVLWRDTVRVENSWVEYRRPTVLARAFGNGDNVALVVSLDAGVVATLYVDDIEVADAPSCMYLYDAHVETMSHSSITVDWNEYVQAANYEVEVTDASGATTTQMGATKPMVVSGLAPNAAYKLRVRGVCGSERGEWSDTVAANTLCEPRDNALFVEQFATGGIPACWVSKQTVGSDNNGKYNYGDAAWYTSSSKTHSAGAALAVRRSYAGIRTLLTAQAVEIERAGKYDLRLWFYREAMTGSDSVIVWVNNRPDLVGATCLDTLCNNITYDDKVAAAGWYKYEYNVPLSGTTYIMLEAVAAYGKVMYLDDIELFLAPTCRKIKDVKWIGETTNSGSFGWTKAVEESQWIVDYTVAGEHRVDTVNQPMCVVGGLQPATQYTVSGTARAYCGGTDMGDPVEFSFSFMTLCEAVDVFPFVEGFEDAMFPPKCWSQWQIASADVLDSTAQGWGRNSTLNAYINNGVASAQLYNKPEGYSHILVTPQLNLGQGGYRLTYWHYRHAGYTIKQKEGIRIWINDRPSTEGARELMYIKSNIMMEPMEESLGFYKYRVDIAEGGLKYIIFEGVSENYNSTFIDDVEISAIPKCDEVSSFGVVGRLHDEIALQIYDAGVTDWQVAYGRVDGVPVATEGEQALIGGATYAVATSQSAMNGRLVVGGLVPSTEYKFYARRVCGNERGEWTEVAVTATTLCNPIVVNKTQEWVEGFEDFAVNNAIRGCYLQEYNKNTSRELTAYSTYNEVDYTFDNVWYTINPYAGQRYALATEYNSDNWLFAYVDLVAGENYELSVMARHGSATTTIATKVSLAYGAMPTAEGMTTYVARDVVVDGDWTQVVGSFQLAESGRYFVGIHLENPDYYEKAALDNIRLRVSNCALPASMKVSRTSSNSAVVNVVTLSDSIRIAVADYMFNPASDAANIYDKVVAVNTTEYVVGGLQPNKKYYVSVRGACGEYASDWMRVDSFETRCLPVALPLTETFEGAVSDHFDCWRMVGDGSSEKSTNTRYAGNTGLRANGVTIISPELDVESLDEYMLSGWAYSLGNKTSFAVGVMSDPNSLETFEPIATTTIHRRTEWTQFFTFFAQLNAADFAEMRGAKYVAIVVPNDVDFYFDNLAIERAVVCPNPSEATISNITATSCNVSWMVNGTENQWRVQAYASDGVVAVDTIVKSSSNAQFTTFNAQIAGLQPSQYYDFYVTALCSDVDESVVVYAGGVRTLCKEVMPLPYSEGLEGAEYISDLCFSFINNKAEFPSASLDKAIFVMGGKQALELTMSATEPICVIMPQFEVPTNRLRMSFDYRNETADIRWNTNLVLGLIDDVNDIATFDTLRVLPMKADSTRVYYYFDSIPQAKANARIAFCYGAGPINNRSCAIDNIYIDEIPSCIEPAKEIEVMKITDTTAQFGIDARGATTIEYKLEIVGNKGEIAGEVQLSALNSHFTVRNLSPRTYYDLYVRSVCAEDKKSDWVGPLRFRTNCLDGTPTPWLETFEDYADISESCFITMGTDKDNNPASVATNNSTNIMLGTGRYGNRGEKGMLLSLGKYRSIYVALPRFDAPISELKLLFDYYSEEHDGVTADLILGVMTDLEDELTFKQINAYGTTNGFVTVRQAFETLPAGYDNGYIVLKWCNFREEWSSGPTYYAYCALDNIKVESKASCFAPENISIESISDTSASFSWTQIEDVRNFEYRLQMTANGEQVTDGRWQMTDDSSSLLITNLTPSTNYTLGVRTLCSDTLYSDWTDFGFRTLPSAPTLPYSVDFEDGEADNWILVNGTQTNRLMVGSDTAAVYSGNKALYVSHNDADYFYYFAYATDVHAYRPIRLDAGEYICEFDWRCEGEDTRDYGRVYLVPAVQKIVAGEAIATQAYVPAGCVAVDGGIHLNEQPNWKHQVVEFTIDKPAFYNLVVSWHNNNADGATPPFAIDNIVVRKATCLPVANLRMAAIDDESAIVAWDSQNESCQNYEYKIIDNTGKIIENAQLATLDAQHSIRNLLPSTTYRFAIRALCEGEDVSQWREITFATDKAAVAAPYATGFEEKADNEGWTIINSGNNHFIVGPNDEAVNSGDSALYVHSKEDTYAVSYNYVRNAGYSYTTQYIYAYRLVEFEPGAYYIDYDWKSEGKENEDFARVFLAPTSLFIDPGKAIDMSAVVALDNGPMIGSASWGRQGGVLIANDTVKYRLVVAWQNKVDGTFYTGALPVAIDNMNIERLACNVVDSIKVAVLGSNEATVEFVNLNGDGEVKYWLSKTNSSADATLVATTTNGYVNLLGLESATTYHLFLQALCDDSESPMREVVFTTTKYQYSTPFNATFEDEADNERWSFVHSYGSNKFVINNDPQAVNKGENALYISNGDSAYKYVDYERSVAAYASISLAEAGEYVVSYDYKVKGESGGDYARVFLAPTTAALVVDTRYPFDNLRADFIPLDGGSGLCSDTAIWRNQTVVFDIAEAGNYNLVFSWHNDQYINGNPPIAIDNVVLRKNTCKAIEEVIVHEVADVTATVVVPYEYEAQLLEYRVSLDFDVENAFVSGTAVGDTIALADLKPNTTQYLFVRVKCSDADFSLWKMTEITTYCDGIIEVTKTRPYIDNFEYSDLDPCWIVSQAPRATGVISMLSSLETIVLKATNDVDVRLTRPFRLEAGRRYELSIKSRQRELLEDSRVGFVAGYKGEYDTLAQHPVTQAYEYYDATFTPKVSGVYELGVRVFTPWWCNNSTTYLLTIDEFEVKEVLLSKPENFSADYVSSTEVDLSWTADGLADAHQVQLLINGAVVADTIVTDTVVGFDDLKNSTLYDARVRGLLTLAGDSSSWATLSFRTHCDVVALPFRENFEMAGNNIPDCWTLASSLDEENRDWSVTENSNGNKMATVNTSLAHGYAVLRTPLLYVDSDIYSLMFNYNVNIGNDEYLVARISDDAGYSFNDTILMSNRTLAWDTLEYDLSGYVGKTIMVEFKVRSLRDNSYSQQVNIDDVKIVCRSANEVVFTDHICWGNRYRNYGFDVETSKLNFGLNRIEMLRESQAEGECDTLKVLNLHVDPSGTFYLNDTICPGDVYNEGAFAGYNLTTTGTYLSEPLVSSCGCDSVVRLYLVVQPKRHVIDAAICEGESYEFGGEQLTATGIYVDTISYCEFTTLNLVVYSKYFVHADTICENTYLEWEGMQLNKSGRYEKNYTNHYGCDSIEVMNLWVIPEKVSHEVSICQGTTYYFGGRELSTPGVYYDSLVNILGCDSVVTLTLKVTEPGYSHFDDYVCQGYEYVGYGFRVEGITQDTLLRRTTSTLLGCDSIIEVLVKFEPTREVDTTVVIPSGDVYEFGELTLTKPGQYREVFVSSVGCDSIVNLTLEVGTGVDNIYELPLTVVPNPIKVGETTYVTFDTESAIVGAEMTIINSVGQVVMVDSPMSMPIPVSGIATRGIYFVRVVTEAGEVYVGKIIVN